jgi:CelD/BcsL family acetyltransferase involved in cellulose biosynthesis
MPVTTSAPAASAATEPPCRLVARLRPFEAIPRAAWDRLIARSPAATPFSRWTFHRAWWDAYRPTAHEQYLVCSADERAADDPDAIVAIVPLMHRHEVEPDDAATATRLRGLRPALGTQVEPTAKAVFFGASYHADYATILADPADLPDAARATARALAAPPDPAHGATDWDVLDLRRLRDADPAMPALEAAFRELADGQRWHVGREQEDVCPVVSVPADSDWASYLASLDKKDRHEIRRKLRRAEEAGPLEFRLVEPTPAEIEAFIALHQARWGAEGLFPETEGGVRSRRFLARLAELEMAEGEDRQLQLGRLDSAGSTIFFAAGFDDGGTCYFYNAGMDPEARHLSPGVTGAAAYLRDRIAAGRRRFDFLRGDEPYKYEWGAKDEPIHRLLVTRRAA